MPLVDRHGFTPQTAPGTLSGWLTFLSAEPAPQGWLCTSRCACGNIQKRGLAVTNMDLTCGCQGWNRMRTATNPITTLRIFLDNLGKCCDGEQWQPVVTFPDRYLVSSCGRVYSMYFKRLLCPHVSKSDRYLHVSLVRNGKQQYPAVHVLVLQAFVGPRPEGQETRHLDGSRTNPHLSNLCWGTRQENSDDKLIHGTRLRGSRHGGAKLTEAEVVQIRRLRREQGLRQKDIAARFNVSRGAVAEILKGKNWAHLEG
jgi:DNA-binding XRE family transcriptional regulator